MSWLCPALPKEMCSPARTGNGWNSSSTADRYIAMGVTNRRPHATTAAGTSLPIALRNTNGRFTKIDNSTLNELRRACAKPLAHPEVSALQQYSEQTLTWLLEQFQSLGARPVGRTASVETMESLLREPAPEIGQGFSAALREFQDKVAPFAMRIDHPRFLAFIPTAPTFLSMLGELLCAGTNFFGSVWHEAAGPSQVERLVVD